MTIFRLSLYHKTNPYSIQVNGESYAVDYWPGDSHSGMFGKSYRCLFGPINLRLSRWE